jgi:hypothetical protein
MNTLSPLEKARQARKEMQEAGIPVKVKNPLEKLADKPQSLRRAIDAKCYQCEGEDADPAVKWRIGNCLCDDCALYMVRPYQRLKGTPTPKSLVSSSD